MAKAAVPTDPIPIVPIAKATIPLKVNPVNKLNEGGDAVADIVVKNLIMSSAQIIFHRRNNNHEYEITSENISDRCKAILRLLETKSVTKNVNQVLKGLDNMGNSFDNSTKYDEEQKEFIKNQILDIAQ